MVLVTVMMVIIVMSIFAVSFLNQNLNQNIAVQSQVDKIKMQELAMGAISKCYADLSAGGTSCVISDETMDRKKFTTSIAVGALDASGQAQYKADTTLSN